MKKPATRLRRCNRSSQPTMMDSAAKCGKARTLQRYPSCRGANQTRHAYRRVPRSQPNLYNDGTVSTPRRRMPPKVTEEQREVQKQLDHRNDDPDAPGE